MDTDSKFFKISAMIVIPLFALIIPIFLFFWDHKDKKMSFEVVSESTVADVASPLGKNIQVLYNGKKLNNLKSIFIRILNSGSTPIKKNDFEGDLQLFFGKNTRVLASRVDYAYPENLSIKTTVKDGRVHVSPLLLNPKDEFTIESLVTGEADEIAVDVRIEGITQTILTEHGHQPSSKRKMLQLIAGILCLVAYIYSTLSLFELFRQKGQPKIFRMRPLEILFIVIATLLSSALLIKEATMGTDLPFSQVVLLTLLASISSIILLYLFIRRREKRF